MPQYREWHPPVRLPRREMYLCARQISRRAYNSIKLYAIVNERGQAVAMSKNPKLEKLSCKKLKEYLDFSNRFCGLSVQKHGAIDSYPTLPEMGL